MKSIISNDHECWVCGDTRDLHRHHIYGGACRNLSETHGLWIYLCPKHHNMSNEGIHFDRRLDLFVKEHAQRRWEERYGKTHDDFRAIFGRSYL